MNTNFPKALPHDPIAEVFPDLFVVRGRFQFNAAMTITRNMIVVRDAARALTIINSVRLSPEGEAALEALGEVRHLIKLGAFHGMDDPYYAHRYRPQLHALPGARHDLGLKTDVELREGGPLPFSGARLFVFQNARQPEGAILVEREGGILLTCDSVQNYTELSGMSLAAKVVMSAMGFKHPAWIGRPWRQAMERPGGPPLRADFERLLTWPFEHVVPGHGAPLRGGAPAALRATVDALWPRRGA